MLAWIRQQFRDVERARHSVLTFALALGCIGFAVFLAALLLR